MANKWKGQTPNDFLKLLVEGNDKGMSLGKNCNTDSSGATAFGLDTSANKEASTSMGLKTIADSSYSTAMGYNTQTGTDASCALVIGSHNKTVTNALFLIGSGKDNDNSRNIIEVIGNPNNSANDVFNINCKVDVSNNLSISGTSTFNDVSTFNKDVTMKNKLDVSGLDVSNNIVIGGTSTFNNDVTIKNKLNVSGLDVSNNIVIGGTSTFNKDVTMKNKLDVSGLDVSNNLLIGGTSTFNKDVTMKNKLDVSGLDVSNNLIVNGIATFKDNVTMENVSIFKGNVGIGTTNPEYPLQISNAVGFSISSPYTVGGFPFATTLDNRYFYGSPSSGYISSNAMSHDGKYRTICVNKGHIYNSDDSGNNWVSYTNFSDPTGKMWNGIAMSSNGRNRAACAWTEGIWLSSDFGETWYVVVDSVTSEMGLGTFKGIAMSDDGQIIVAIAASSGSNTTGNKAKLWRTINGGATWTQFDGSKGSDGIYTDIAIRGDGMIALTIKKNGQVQQWDFSGTARDLPLQTHPDGQYNDPYWSITMDSVGDKIIKSSQDKPNVDGGRIYYTIISNPITSTQINNNGSWGMITHYEDWRSISYASTTGLLCGTYDQINQIREFSGNAFQNKNVKTVTYISQNNYYPLSIKTAGSIWVDKSYINSSDRRIKTNIQDVPDNLALQQLRDIPCRYYEYKDKIERGPDKTIGFIAQEVKEIMPMAIAQEKQIIPDVYKSINCDWTLDNSDINNLKYKMSSADLSNVSGIKYKFYVSNNVDPSKPFDLSTNNIDSNGEKTVTIIGNSDDTFTFDNKYNNVFCYGNEVDDFHTLDKNKLFTLNFSATQEIDRIQQAHVTKIDELKLKVTTLETKMTSLKTENAYLKTIVDKLTSATSFEDFKSKM